MTNGNDYLELEELYRQEIQEDYISAIKEGIEEIPEEYKLRWIDLVLEGD